jgi:hypothetical protein
MTPQHHRQEAAANVASPHLLVARCGKRRRSEMMSEQRDEDN